MAFLITVASIVVIFAAVLSIRAHIHAEYESGGELEAYVKYLFFKIQLLPAKEKPPKEKKKPEPEQAQEESEEEKPAEAKKKGANPLKALYDNEGVEGILDLLKRILALLDKFGARLVNSFVIDEMFLDITVARDDAAQTAIEYGKMCRRVFPVTGAVCAVCNVKKYSINIDPDYLAGNSGECAFSMEISLNPRRAINSVLLLAFGFLAKLGLRLIKSLTKKSADTNKGGEDNGGDPPAEDSFTPDGPLDADNPLNMPKNQKPFKRYEPGTVHEPEIT